LINLFDKAFTYTSIPEKALFGTNNYSISLLTGGIFFVAYTIEGVIWILLDKPFYNIPNSSCKIVKSTKNFSEPLFWLETNDLNNLNTLINHQELWLSYSLATERIYASKVVTAYKKHIAKDKITLSEILENASQHLTTKTLLDFEGELEEKIELEKKLSKEKRREKLLISDPKPIKTIVKQTVFQRNEYVIVEVLDRANGFCERCKEAAPFLRDHNQSPYLEVHHKKPLAEGGNDTVENAIALCPNCHRHAHFGKSTY
jgi:5-methylcytosine-specific restriction endonuclease McrA